MYFVFIIVFQISLWYSKILFLFVSNQKIFLYRNIKNFLIVFYIYFLNRKILHLTDVHIDLAYMEGAEAACGSLSSKTTKKQIVPYIFDLPIWFKFIFHFSFQHNHPILLLKDQNLLIDPLVPNQPPGCPCAAWTRLVWQLARTPPPATGEITG